LLLTLFLVISVLSFVAWVGKNKILQNTLAIFAGIFIAVSAIEMVMYIFNPVITSSGAKSFVMHRLNVNSGLNFNDDDLLDLQLFIMNNPNAGDVIVGTGGAIKLRHALHGKGKSGGVRVIYTDIPHKSRAYLLLCYGKSEQDDLTSTQKKQLEVLIKIIKGEN